MLSARWRTTYWEQRERLDREDQRAIVEPEIIVFDLGGIVDEEKGIFRYIIWITYMIGI